MTVKINADTTNGAVITSDTSGEIELQAGGTKIATVKSTGLEMASGKNLKNSDGKELTNRPIMQAIMGSNTTISHNTATLVPYSVEQVDTDSAYDNTTYTFTVPSGKDGLYYIHAETRVDDGTSNVNNALMKIQKNGGDLGRNYQNVFNNPVTALQLSVSGCWSLVAGDEIKVYCQMATANGTSGTLSAGTYNRFHIHRLIG